jgi:hypothetical protein
MYTPKINAFHIETLILLEKYDKIIAYINECNLFPGKTVVIIDKADDSKKEPDVKTLPQ